jgi:hypothetical protein
MSGQFYDPAAITPGGRAPITQETGRGPELDLPVVEMMEISCPCQESNINSLTIQPITIPTKLSQSIVLHM